MFFSIPFGSKKQFFCLLLATKIAEEKEKPYTDAITYICRTKLILLFCTVLLYASEDAVALNDQPTLIFNTVPWCVR